MRKALLPLLLIMAMALIVSVAMASDYSTTGPIGSDPGWSTSGNWNGNSPAGSGDARASHDVTTGPSGKYSLDVGFTIGNAANEIGAGINAAGNSVRLSYANGNVLLNGNIFGQVSLSPSTTYYARFSSEDGTACHVEICGVASDVAFTGAPTSIFVELLTVKGTAPAITSVNFVSSDAVVTPVPSPTAEPVSTGITYDAQKVREFYAKENNIYSPYDIITYNPDGTYTVTPGYPTSDGTAAAAPATCTVTGTVMAAADGKPVEGASVVLGDAIKKTDGLGKFQFDGVSKGSFDVAVSADGFASKTMAVIVSADQDLAFALDPASAGGSTVASAANETGNVTPAANTTAPIVPASNTTPVPTQTKAPGFEAILSALAMIAVAGLVLIARRKK